MTTTEQLSRATTLHRRHGEVLPVRGVVVVAAVVATVLAVSMAVPSWAGAAAGHGEQGSVLWQTSADSTDYVFREITIAPGGSTRWHWHDRRLYGVIKHGALTHNMSDCSIDGIYQAADSIAEPSGADHVHIGRNVGATPLVMQILCINPASSPVSEDAPIRAAVTPDGRTRGVSQNHTPRKDYTCLKHRFATCWVSTYR